VPCPVPPRKTGMRRAYFGAACISLQPMLLSALMLPVTAYVIRGLGAVGYGHWAMATTLVAVVAFVANPGLRGKFIRSVAREPETAADRLAEQLGVRVVLGILAVALASAACLLLGYSHTVLLCTLIGGAALVLLTVSTTIADMLQAQQRLPTIASVNMAAGLVLSAASLLAVWLGAGPIGVAASYVIGPMVSVALLCWVLRRQQFPIGVRWNPRRAVELIWDGRHIASQQVVWSAAQHAQALIIPRIAGAALFGYFSAGTLLATRLTTIPEGLCSAAYPAMVDAYRNGPRAALRVFFRFLALVIPVSVVAALGVSFVAGPIARLLFPRQPQVCEQVMRITIWLLPTMGLHFLLGYLLQTLDRDSAQARMTVVGAAFSLALTAVLVWKWGIVGACWSMVLRYVVDLAMEIPYLVRTVRPLLALEAAGLRASAAASPTQVAG
jgi:O-antigen/teichoic acid export membrane protein